MKFSNILRLCSLLAFSYSHVDATNLDTNIIINGQNYLPEACQNEEVSNFGSAGFSVTDTSLWYTIETNSYPNTVPLSQNRNRGVSEGDVYLSPNGFTIGEAGNYWVSFSAVLQNPGSDGALIPVFLVIDETFDFDSPSLLGGVVALPPNEIGTVNATGILKDLPAGSRISLVATNGGNPFPQPINVSAWSISLHKL